MNFGQHLRGPREAAGLTRAELARKGGVSLSALPDREGGRGLPGLSGLRRLAEALGVPVERFAEGVEDPAVDEPAVPPVKPRRRKRKAP
ncbi:MAG TPA: helix-turn-helix transcriptional regulator [Gemmataceae bacterium]|nr:helix-turn-helix transcriptional regulator [Gemmataceae bacterium]